MNNDIERVSIHFSTKLLIFYFHDRLLDCSLLVEPNPNTSIPMTMRSLTRRFVFRPWLTEFINKCFRNIRVAFWSIKSNANMEDVPAEMIQKFGGLDSHNICFVGQQRNVKKLLRTLGCQSGKNYCPKVWGIWPKKNEGNTLITNHMQAMVDYNHVANIIILFAFYVDNMINLTDDNNYMIKHLCLFLNVFLDVHQVCSESPNTKQAVGDYSQRLGGQLGAQRLNIQTHICQAILSCHVRGFVSCCALCPHLC